jgi:hypothetical protein
MNKNVENILFCISVDRVQEAMVNT